MAVVVDWGNKIISISKSDLELVQVSPTEIRRLDINWLRLELKNLEDSSDGMPMDDTHRHNPPVEVGGVTLARVVEIINDYTITFEDGAYAVNLYGANSNAGDRVNVNQVSVRSANSAGLVTSDAIEYGEYNGGVTVNITDGEAGTVYPIGTGRRPVNNIPDAMIIANARGFSKLFIIGDLTLSTGDNCQNMTIIGESPIHTSINVLPPANVLNCIFLTSELTGTLDGNNIIDACHVQPPINYVNGSIQNSQLCNGEILLGGNTAAHFLNCWSGVIGEETPTIDMNGSGNSLGMRNYNGGIKITNKTGPESCILDINSGQVNLTPSVINGEIVIRGVGKLTDNSTGTTIVSAENFLNKDIITSAVWDEDLANHTLPESTGEAILGINYNKTCYIDSVNGVDGTDYPSGTNDDPVKTIASALSLLSKYNLNTIYVNGVLTIPTAVDVSNITFTSPRSTGNTITVTDGAITNDTYFDNLTMIGTFNGRVRLTECVCGELNNFHGGMKNSLLTDNINFLNSDIACYLTSCDTYTTSTNSYKQLNIGIGSLNMIKCNGDFEIINKTGETYIDITMSAGHLKIADSCTNGIIHISGIAALDDYSTAGCEVRAKHLMTTPTITSAVWDELLSEHTITGSAGNKLNTASSGGVDYGALSDAVWNESMTEHTTNNTAGAMMTSTNSMALNILGLTQHNFRMTDQAYNTKGNMTASKISIYNTAEDTNNEENSITTYQVNVVYDTDEVSVTDYKVVEL